MRHKLQQQAWLRRRMERQLHDLAEKSQEIVKFRDAVGNMAGRIPDEPEPHAGQRAERRIPFERAVQVTPLAPARSPVGPPLLADVHDISANGIGLVHDRAIDAEQVLLTIDFEDARQLSFVVRLRWRNRAENGRLRSGGTVLGVWDEASLTCRSSKRPAAALPHIVPAGGH
jgi:hypothetical protein